MPPRHCLSQLPPKDARPQGYRLLTTPAIRAVNAAHQGPPQLASAELKAKRARRIEAVGFSRIGDPFFGGPPEAPAPAPNDLLNWQEAVTDR